MSLIKNIVNVNSQPELYKLVKDIHVTDHGERETVPYFIEDVFDSDYKQGVDKANGPASDDRYHDFGKGKWQLSGDNQPCNLDQAVDMVLRTVLYSLLTKIQSKLSRYFTVTELGNKRQSISYLKDSKTIHQVANEALNQIAQWFYSTQNDSVSKIFDSEVSDYGIEERETILNDSDEFNQFSKSEQGYIKNSGYDYFISRETVKPSNFVAPDDVSSIAGNLAGDLSEVEDLN